MFIGISYAGVDDVLYKCTINAESLKRCFEYYYDSVGLGFTLENGTSAILANLTYDFLDDYIDVDNLDTSYETLNLVIRGLLTYMVETNDTLITENSLAQSLLDYTIGWGYKCETDQHDYGRGGFCSFTVRHLVAAHSVASYLIDNVENSQDLGVDVDNLFIMVERDGAVRNSIVAQYAQLMYQNDETKIGRRAYGCMWLIDAVCQEDNDREIDNTCGVPHAWYVFCCVAFFYLDLSL